MAVFDAASRERVKEAVARAERGTAGEIVVVVAERAADYGSFRALCTLPLLVALTAEGLRLTSSLGASAGLWFLLQLPLGVLLFWLLGTGPLVRLLVPRALRASAVEACAQRAFVEFGLTETRDRSGVLVLVTEAEHRVHILADQGIHARVQAGAWQQHVDALVRSIRAGAAADGLVTLVDELGTLLGQHFPPRSDDRNELSDDVRVLGSP